MPTADRPRRHHPAPGRALTIPLVVLAVVLGLTACGRNEAKPTSTAVPTTRALLPVDFSLAGPYQVGTTTIDIGGRDAVVYYPANTRPPVVLDPVAGYDAAEALPDSVRAQVPGDFVPPVTLDVYQDPPANPEGPFPVVIHSHGEGGYYLYESRHFQQLASWGFVVAAPDHRERSLASTLVPPAEGEAPPAADQDVTDLHATWQALRDQNVRPGGVLMGALNLDDLAVEGTSAGGRTAVAFAADPAVKALVLDAPMPPVDPGMDALEQQVQTVNDGLASLTPPAKPSLVITGEQDKIVPPDLVRATYAWLAPPKTLAVLRNAGHNAFSDLCPPIRTHGGLAKAAATLPPAFLGLLREQDGCLPTNLDPDRGFALINQLTIAQLRWAFGIDPDRTSLDPDFLERTFGDALSSIESAGV